jgi:UDP-N-acetyl-D-glucosamine dehydrogenase
MPSYIADRAESLLLERGLELSGAHVLGVGVAYKPDVTRVGGSASLRVVEEMDRRGAIVSIMDPLVGEEEISGLTYNIVDASDELTAFDLAIILTDHDFLDLARISERVPAVLDTRDAYRRRGLRSRNVTII